MPKTYISMVTDHGMEGSSKKSPLANPFQQFDYREFACGWGSAFINIAATYPLYKTIFRQVRMTHGPSRELKQNIYLASVCTTNLLANYFGLHWHNYFIDKDVARRENRHRIRSAATRRPLVSLSRNVPASCTKNSFVVADVRHLRWSEATGNRVLWNESIHGENICSDSRRNFWGCFDAIWTCSNNPCWCSLSSEI